MKLKFTSKWIWAISLTAGLASAIAISLTANSIYAEQPASSERTIRLNPALGTADQQFPEFAGIDLTPEQQEQIRQIRQEMQPEFEAIFPRPELTPEQRNQLNSGEPVRISLPPPPPEQQAKIQQVMQAYRQKVEVILTPEQQQQFRENKKKDVIFFDRTRDN